jgi:hypothetical protein
MDGSHRLTTSRLASSCAMARTRRSIATLDTARRALSCPVYRALSLAGLGRAQALLSTIDVDRLRDVPSLVDLLSLIGLNAHLDRNPAVVPALSGHDEFWPFMPEVIDAVLQPVPKMPTVRDTRLAGLVIAPAVAF